MPRATLYVIPGSHPAMAVRGMLEHKGIAYRRVDLMPVVSHGVLWALRFPGTTIPSLRIDGERITGSRAISKALDRIQPEPALFPSDPVERVAIEDAERWAEEVPQRAVRRILWNAFKRNRDALRSYAEGARLGVPLGLAVKTAAPIIAAEFRMHGINDPRVRDDLAALPGMLKRIDDWLADGTLGGHTAADFQIAASIRLALTLDDLRPHIEGRPAGEHALEVIPEYPGHLPPVLPEAWLEPLATTRAA